MTAPYLSEDGKGGSRLSVIDQGSRRPQGPLEAVEDQVEPERERPLLLRTAFLEVLVDVLDEVG